MQKQHLELIGFNSQNVFVVVNLNKCKSSTYVVCHLLVHTYYQNYSAVTCTNITIGLVFVVQIKFHFKNVKIPFVLYLLIHDNPKYHNLDNNNNQHFVLECQEEEINLYCQN